MVVSHLIPVKCSRQKVFPSNLTKMSLSWLKRLPLKPKETSLAKRKLPIWSKTNLRTSLRKISSGRIKQKLSKWESRFRLMTLKRSQNLSIQGKIWIRHKF